MRVGTPGSIINIGASYAWTGGPGFAHSAAAKAGIKNMTETLSVEWGPYGIQINGLVPGLFPHEDMTADILSNLDRTSEKDLCQPALRVGRLRELGWAATFLASPFARFISGYTLVVDGANWQRRHMTMPPVVTIRDQMGRGPFTSERLVRRGRARQRSRVIRTVSDAIDRSVVRTTLRTASSGAARRVRSRGSSSSPRSAYPPS